MSQRTNGKIQKLLLPRLAGLAIGALPFAILAIVLPADAPLTLLLVDKTTVARSIPYPITIHLFLYLISGLSVGELWVRIRAISVEEAAIESNFLPTQQGSIVTVNELAEISRQATQTGRGSAAFLPDAIVECIAHYELNRSISSTREILQALAALRRQRIGSDYAQVRYIVWAIPTLGFLGTVMGFSNAIMVMDGLFKTDKIDLGTIATIIHSLGMAFNTTIVALVFSAVITWVTQIAASREARVINRAEEHVLRNLLNRIYSPELRS